MASVGATGMVWGALGGTGGGGGQTWCRDGDWQNPEGRKLPTQPCSWFRLLEGLLGTAGRRRQGDKGVQEGALLWARQRVPGPGPGEERAWTAQTTSSQSPHWNPWTAQPREEKSLLQMYPKAGAIAPSKSSMAGRVKYPQILNSRPQCLGVNLGQSCVSKRLRFLTWVAGWFIES